MYFSRLDLSMNDDGHSKVVQMKQYGIAERLKPVPNTFSRPGKIHLGLVGARGS